MKKSTAATELENWANDQVIDTYVETKELVKARINTAKGRKKAAVFPIDAFPPFCQDMMRAYQYCFGAAPDHYGLTMLTVAGTVLGNCVWAVERGNTHPPLLYSVIVDKPGRGKTPIARECMRPLVKIEQQYREAHADALRRHREAHADSKGSTPPPPVGKEMILNDFTLESVYKVLQANPRGVIVYRDEVAGWLNSMNAYKNKGGDEQFWLENYNSGLVKINRQKADRALFVRNCFASVLGTTQPAILAQFAEGNKAYNGFLARILFSYPEDTAKISYNNRVPDSVFREKWAKIIERMYNLPCQITSAADDLSDAQIEPTLIHLSSKAATLYQEYYDKIATQVNESEDEIEQAVLTKFDSHVLRLALILTFLHWAEKDSALTLGGITVEADMSMEDLAKIQITEAAMQGAINLANYFSATVRKVVGRLASPIEQLPENYKIWYESLPEEVERAAAIEVAKEAQIGERTIGRLFNRTDLFRRVRQGVYLKNFV